MKITIVPRARLLAAILIGAVWMGLATVNSIWWLIATTYYLVLLAWVVSDCLRLPRRAGFEAQRVLPKPFSLGATSEILLKVHHPAAAGMRAELADHAAPQLQHRPRLITSQFDLDGRLEARYEARPPTRGSFQMGRLDFRCWRPQGWLVRQVRLPLDEECAVYPDILAVRRYQLGLRRHMPLLTGMRRTRPPGAASAFASLRDYLPGDEIRRINWKATARKDMPVTNELEAERGQQVVIAIDCGRLMTAPAGELTKLDHAVNAALLIAWVSDGQGDRVGLVGFSDSVQVSLPPGRGARQLHALNQALYSIEAQYVETDFRETFTHISARFRRRSLVIVLTDLLDSSASADLVTQALWLSRRHRVLVVAMSDPALLMARDSPITDPARAYEWAAAEELLASRRASFELMRRGGVLSLDVAAGLLRPALVERYLELKERALV